MTARYYYVDDLANPDDLEYEEYASAEEFYEGMLWNREVAKEYGDKVPTLKTIQKEFKEPNMDEHFNGASFVKLTTITIEEYLERGF